MVPEESKQQSPHIPKQPNTASNAHQSSPDYFSPGFRSAAAMAGWDEEALLFASLVVEDTPDRRLKQKKRSNLQLVDTPPTNSRKKGKFARRSSIGIEIPVIDLDEIETTDDSEKKTVEIKVSLDDEKKKKIDERESAGQGDDEQCPKPALPCMDRLREELSCAICLDICFEPSSTPCGHSFCKKCLRSAADKCGKKCPKCRQLISNGRSCTVNTVLWNTIQLLFPQEVEARKAAALQKVQPQGPPSAPSRHNNNDRNRTVEDEQRIRRRAIERGRRRGGGTRSQDGEDAALALRLQRRDFMEAFRVPNQGNNPSSSTREQRRRRSLA